MTYPQHSKYKPGGCPWFPSIPVHWRTLPLKWAITFQRGHDLPAEEREDGEVPVVSSGGISDKHSKSSANAPGIVTGRYGSIGEFYLLERDYWPLNTTLFSVDLHGNRAQYLRYMLQHLSPLFVMNAVKSAVPGVDRNDIHPIRTALPPLPEQRTIADFLDRETDRLDDLILMQTRLDELLSDSRKAIVASVVCHGMGSSRDLRASGIEWLGEIPTDWKLTPVKRLFRLIVDPAPDDHGMELLSLYTDIGVRPRKEMEARGNRASTTDGYFRVRKGDFVFNKLLAWMGAIGISEYDGVTSPAYDILRPIVPMAERYYDYLFRCGVCLTEFRRHSRGIMDMRLRLYFDKLGPLLMPQPSLEEQAKIVEHLDRETTKIDAIRLSVAGCIEKLREYRSSLISAAVTGQIDVRNYRPQEATVLCQ